MTARDDIAKAASKCRVGGPQLTLTDYALADAMLAAYHAWIDANGWQIVPKRLTTEMLNAIDDVEPRKAREEDIGFDEYYDFQDQWDAALVASPKPSLE